MIFLITHLVSLDVEAATVKVPSSDITYQLSGTRMLLANNSIDTSDVNNYSYYEGSLLVGFQLPNKYIGDYLTGVCNLTVNFPSSAGSTVYLNYYNGFETSVISDAMSIVPFYVGTNTVSLQFRFNNYYASEASIFTTLYIHGIRNDNSIGVRTYTNTLSYASAGVSLKASDTPFNTDEVKTVELKEGHYVINDDGSYTYVEETKTENLDDGGLFSRLFNAITSIPQKIVEGFKSLFIPSNDYFSDWFDDLNAFFTDHLGFLWQPIEWTVSVVSAFLGSGGSTTLTFPGFSIMGYQIWNDVQVDLAQIWGEIPVQDYIYMATDLIIIGSIVALVYKKYEEVMTG